jgi:hypothetical protein
VVQESRGRADGRMMVRERDRNPRDPAGDSATDGAPSAGTRVRRRAVRTLRARNRSRSERIDTATGGRRRLAGTTRSCAAPDAGTRSSRRSRSRVHHRRQLTDARLEVCERLFAGARLGADQHQPGRDIAGTQHRPQAAAQSVAGDGRPGGAADREPHSGRNHSGIGDEGAPQRIDPQADAFSPKTDEGVSLLDPADQADRRARPLARRDLSTARPARVLMRARNPCLRARRRLLGW